MSDRKNEIIFLFCRPTDPIFFAVLPVDQKIKTQKSRQKFKYLENEKSFEREIKSIFHHF